VVELYSTITAGPGTGTPAPRLCLGTIGASSHPPSRWTRAVPLSGRVFPGWSRSGSSAAPGAETMTRSVTASTGDSRRA